MARTAFADSGRSRASQLRQKSAVAFATYSPIGQHTGGTAMGLVTDRPAIRRQKATADMPQVDPPAMTDPLNLKVGDAIRDGDYRVLETVSRTAESVVYAAQQVRVGRRVAMKMRLGEDARSASAAEARALAAVSSLYVAQIWDRHVEGDAAWLAIEYAGSPLSAHDFAQRPLPLPVAVGVVADLLSGLDDLHRAGYVHRAVCPSHVLIHTEDITDATAVQQVKLAGLGWACAPGTALTDSVAAQRLLGACAGFVAPEVMAGVEISPSADLYSVGRILPFLLGIGDSDAVSGRRLRAGEFKRWLECALSMDPQQRFGDAQAMRKALLDVPLTVEETVLYAPVSPVSEQPPAAASAVESVQGDEARNAPPTSTLEATPATAVSVSVAEVPKIAPPIGDTIARVNPRPLAADLPTQIGLSAPEAFSPEYTPTRYMMVPARAPARSTALARLPARSSQLLAPRHHRHAFHARTQRIRRPEGGGQGLIVATGLLCMATIYWASNLNEQGISDICASVDCDGVGAWGRDTLEVMRERAAEWSQRGAETTARFVDLAIRRAGRVLRP